MHDLATDDSSRRRDPRRSGRRSARIAGFGRRQGVTARRHLRSPVSPESADAGSARGEFLARLGDVRRRRAAAIKPNRSRPMPRRPSLKGRHRPEARESWNASWAVPALGARVARRHPHRDDCVPAMRQRTGERAAGERPPSRGRRRGDRLPVCTVRRISASMSSPRIISGADRAAVGPAADRVP